MILNILDVTIKNFRSFGDYETKLRLDGLGPVLVVGELDGNALDSNGAGKTTLVDAIVWCLFGRVPTKSKPAGDAVVNFFTGKDCVVRITTLDGHTVTRTRGVDGHDDLLIHTADGKDISLSTNPNTQKFLNKLFNLDYDIFMSSIFFAQFGQPFLALPDLKRKKALERMLHLTKYDIIAEVAKEKVGVAIAQQAEFIASKEQANRTILRLTQSVDKTIGDSQAHEVERERRLCETRTTFTGIDEQFVDRAAELQSTLAQARADLEKIQTHDIERLEREWSEYQGKIVKLDGEQKRIAMISEEIAKNTSERNTLLSRRNTFNPTAELARLNSELADAESALSQIVVPDRAEIQKHWEKHESLTKTRNTLKQQVEKLETHISRINAEQGVIKAEKDKWESSAGQICSQCQQPITEEHVRTVSHPFDDKIANNNETIAKIQEKIAEYQVTDQELSNELMSPGPGHTIAEVDLIARTYQNAVHQVNLLRQSIKHIHVQQNDAAAEEKTRNDRVNKLAFEIKTRSDDLQRKVKTADATKASLEGAKPKVTIAEAVAVKRLFDSKNQEISAIEDSIATLDAQKKQMKNDIRAEIARIEKETNPYKKIIDQLTAELNDTKTELMNTEKKVTQFNTIIKHFDYIRSSYSDRKKIKAHTIGKMMPYLNQRIAYYFDALGIGKCQLEFNAFLQVKTNRWPYDQHSGGEQKRIDVAVMFAIYDLHTSLYEQRCNLLVLDEVDGRLDPGGINYFVNLLYKDFIDSQKEARPKAILVISHKNEMRDAFPAKIMIKKEGDFSRLAEIS